MAELADATVLGAVFERSAGSSPVIRIHRGYVPIDWYIVDFRWEQADAAVKPAGMVKLADTLDSKSNGVIRKGSNPFASINKNGVLLKWTLK